MRNLEPVHLAEALRQVPGKWVAVRKGEIVEVRETFDRLMLALAERELDDVTVLRSPDTHESELVGLG